MCSNRKIRGMVSLGCDDSGEVIYSEKLGRMFRIPEKTKREKFEDHWFDVWVDVEREYAGDSHE